MKKCSKCGKEGDINEDFYKGKASWCKTCCNAQYKVWKSNNREKLRAINRASYHRIKDTPNYKFSRTRASAKQRKIEFTLERQTVISILSNKCYYCGTTKQLGLDRIDNQKGYVEGNVTACCYRCNVAKNTLTQREFIDLCHKITKIHKK